MFAISHRLLCRLLNGPQHSRFQTGIPPERNAGNEAVQLSAEQWFFINGIATGQNWLQSNLDRLALTFRREMIGIRNPTKGILFDLIECLVQRDLNYRTGDIRAGCVVIKEALESPRLQKVVLILHSQGGIEGSAIIDWLCADVSDSALAKLEVYTFGNAARHFNNPIRYFAHPQNRIPHVANRPQPLNLIESRPSERVIRHIEHYANEDDFVAKIGVLKFSPSVAKKSMKVNPFHGAVYTRKATGHLLNQHYLDFMFEMKDGIVQESNPFMDSLVDSNGAVSEEALCNGDAAIGSNVCTTRQVVAMKSLSRLWGYRNGRTPAMSASEAHGESRGTW
ncbi:hypothetical protein MMC11_006375 [Xylographa trunciseda]|nr:hypothetical protein [Xylographa trunciseda]